MPQHVLDALAASEITDIHLLGARGPAQAESPAKELRELGELHIAEVLVDPKDLVLDLVSASAVATSRTAARNLQVLERWARRAPMHKDRRIHLHFLTRPSSSAAGAGSRRSSWSGPGIDELGWGGGTGDLTSSRPTSLCAQSVTAASPSPASRSTRRAGSSPIGADGSHVEEIESPGQYVAGWIKRGPSGVIGTNKKDAAETVDALCADLDSLPRPSVAGPDHVMSLLGERGVEYVTFDGWRAIDAAEIVLGQSRGRERTTLHEPTTLLEIARGEVAH